jgi:hypothetical protein
MRVIEARFAFSLRCPARPDYRQALLEEGRGPGVGSKDQ